MPKLMNTERAKEVMQRHGLDALVACTPPNFHYISGYGSDSHNWGGGDFAILPNRDDIPITLIIPNHELALPGDDPDWRPELRTFGKEMNPTEPPGYKPLPAEARYLENYRQGMKKNWQDRIQALGETLVELGLSKAHVGFDDVRYAHMLQERGLFNGKVMDGIWPFREIRIIKTPREIEIIRKVNEINLTGIQDVINSLREGVFWFEALKEHDVRLAKEGVLRSVVNRVSGIGRLGITFFHKADVQAYKVQPGDMIRFDFEGELDGYWTDLGRTCVVGEPTENQRRNYEALVEARDGVLDWIRPGIKASEVCGRAKETIEKVRKGANVGGNGSQMAMCHAIGLELYEAWCWHPHGDFVFEDGMTFNYETPYFEMGWGAMQLEDTFLVTKDGPVDLSSTMSRELFVI